MAAQHGDIIMKKIRWGLLAAGSIAQAFAKGLQTCKTGSLYAAASRSEEKARAFAQEFGAEKYYGSYEALLADQDVDAVYISTLHPMHMEWTIKAAEAGKHILVEKPIAVNENEAAAMIDAAKAANVFLMEAYMYRCNPQTAKIVELIRNGAIGDVSVIKATFSFHAAFNPESRIWNNDLAGGGILDVGGYTTSCARLIAGAAIGLPFANPVDVSGTGTLHPETGVDMWAAATLKFESGIVAQVSCGVGVNQENILQVFGSKGRLQVPAPYAASRNAPQPGRILVCPKGKDQPEIIDVKCDVTSFSLEADVCGNAIISGRTQAQSPAMSWDDSLGNIRTLDEWRKAIGLTYKGEYKEIPPSTEPIAL